jgi:hypothetical protein
VTRDRGKLYAYLAFVGVFAALNYASRLVPNKPDRNVLYTWSAAIGGLVQLAIVLGIVLAIARDRPKDEYLGLRRPSSWGLAAGLIVLVLIGVFALSAVLSPLLHPGEEQGLVPKTWHPDRAAPFVANFIVVAVLAPIVEEVDGHPARRPPLRPRPRPGRGASDPGGVRLRARLRTNAHRKCLPWDDRARRLQQPGPHRRRHQLSGGTCACSPNVGYRCSGSC